MELEDWWAKKAELPNFTRTDPSGWIAKAESFFLKHEIHGFDKVQWTFMSLDAWILIWFRSWDQENPDPTWESFCIGLIRRFGNQELENKAKKGVKEALEEATSANQLCTARGSPSDNQEPSEKSESIKSGKLTEQESMKKDSEKEENPVSRLWLKKETSHALNDPFGWMNSARKFFLIQKTYEEDERSIKDLNSGNLDMEEIMFSSNKQQWQRKKEAATASCVKALVVSIKIPASLVLSPDWKVQLETTGITVIGKPTMKELHLMAYSLIVAPPPPPKPPDLKDSSNELPHLKEGATKEDIEQLSKFTFQRKSKEKLAGNTQGPVGGIMTECQADSPIEHVLADEDAECCICLSAYDDGVELRQLPCGHHFHCACVDKWLHINATCPLCKYNILKSTIHGQEEV